MGVKDKINGARDGDVVKVNAHGYDKMPWSVMDTLKENRGVSLVITWNGKTITIPANMAQKNESGRIYWAAQQAGGTVRGDCREHRSQSRCGNEPRNRRTRQVYSRDRRRPI